MNTKTELNYFSQLIEYQANTLGQKPYILFEDQTINYADFNSRTCSIANGLSALGAQPGDGISILMENCPEYLYVFYGIPRAGLYSVPINTALKGDGLKYIITHSDSRYLIVDESLYPKIRKLESELDNIKGIIVRRTTDKPLPKDIVDFGKLLDASSKNPDYDLKEGAITHLMYTSGTTGLPKGVVTRLQAGALAQLERLSSSVLRSDDTLYTCLPLFHANALNITAGWALVRGISFGLDRKFSASRFWDRIRFYGATQFNGIGSIIPILMKQPEKPGDRDNPVRLVLSSACPPSLWKPFENRFDLKVWEAYGAVDGGGINIYNFGTAPVGSVGTPPKEVEWKLADDDGNEVPQGEAGEFIARVLGRKIKGVEYYKNPEASARKEKDGWIRSGDIFYADEDQNLFFVDRKTDSMRRSGENISSWEVENVIEKHADVAGCAAFGVPSEMGENEVMVWVKPEPGSQLDLKDLVRHCAENMAYFMVPRYFDIVDNMPLTGTLRVQKVAMKKQGVTDKTWDRIKEMPELVLKKK